MQQTNESMNIFRSSYTPRHNIQAVSWRLHEKLAEHNELLEYVSKLTMYTIEQPQWPNDLIC